jgi:hypothetical protein
VASAAGTEAVDQSMTSITSGLALPGLWQSFTAGVSGRLTAVTVTTNGAAGVVSFNLNVYAGTGTGGTLLSSTPISFDTSNPANTDRKMLIPVGLAPTLTAGQVYTFQISGGPAWGTVASNANPYAGGQCSISASYDMYFKTHVTTGYDLGSGKITFPIGITTGAIGFTDWQQTFTNTGAAAFVAGMRASNAGFFEMTNKVTGFTGLARLDSTGAWTISSDRRLKTDISPAVGNLDAALQLRPVHYKWIAEGEKGTAHTGFIAQEVREVLPEFVIGDEDKGTLTVNYGQMSVVAIGAVQELKAENDQLKARIAALESLASGGGLTLTQSAGLGAGLGLPIVVLAAMRRRKAAK